MRWPWLLCKGLPFILGSEKLANTAKQMFYHGFNGYMRNAFPLDELSPLSCRGVGPDHSITLKSRLNQVLGSVQPIHDFRGGFALTLIDSMDTLAIFGDVERFHEAVDLYIRTVPSFDIDMELSTFEVNIRVLGGLLSCHQFCVGEFGAEFVKPKYSGELLDLALDLGTRLLKAFTTETGTPAARVNLRTGRKTSVKSNCAAAAGTFLLEFGLLSALTDDTRFYQAAERAVFAIWEMRSELDLLGYEIDIETGNWYDPASTIGAGADSYYEYLLKGYIMFGDPSLLEVYQASRKAIKTHMLDKFGLYRTVNYLNGNQRTGRMDALGAFYPGLLVLEGDIEAARQSFDAYYLAALKFGDGLLPEASDTENRIVLNKDFNLRPELVESAYYLFQATKDPFYLKVGGNVLRLIEERCKTPCGYAVLQDASCFVHSKQDKSESFLLSETLKYLYLLFKEDHWINKLDRPAVFTTEAHFIVLPRFARLNSASDSRCSFASPMADYSMRLLQHWNVGLRSSGIDSYHELWGLDRLSAPRQTSSSIPLHHELVPIPEGIFLYSKRLGIFTGNNITLTAWPDVTNPQYSISQVGLALFRHDEEVLFVVKRKKHRYELKRYFVQNRDEKWVHLPLKSNLTPRIFATPQKCSRHVFPFLWSEPVDVSLFNITEPYRLSSFSSFKKIVPVGQVISTLVEGRRPLIWAGLPVRNAYYGYLIDYAYNHAVKVKN